MQGMMLTVGVERTAELRDFGVQTVPMVYRVQREGNLLRAEGAVHRPGDRMGLQLRGVLSARLWEDLCRQILGELRRRQLRGVYCTLKEAPLQSMGPLLRHLEERLAPAGHPLWVPEECGGWVREGNILVSTALSGGSLRLRLQEAQTRWGKDRTVPLLTPVRERFSFPTPTGQGTPLTSGELERLLERRRAVWFSPELAAKYFLRRTADGAPELVLFDDGETLQRKLALVREMGFPLCAARWEEVREWYTEGEKSFGKKGETP